MFSISQYILIRWFLSPWNSVGQENRSRKPSLQGILLTQGLNVGPLQCRKILYCVSPREAAMHPNVRWEFRLKGV